MVGKYWGLTAVCSIEFHVVIPCKEGGLHTQAGVFGERKPAEFPEGSVLLTYTAEAQHTEPERSHVKGRE